MGSLHFDITGDNSNFLRKLEEVRNGVATTSKKIEESGMSIELLYSKMTSAAASFGIALSAKEIVSNVVRVRGEFQQLEVAFNTMLGSEEKASSLMSQLVDTAAKTPFDLQGVANGAKQLLAYGTEAENVNDTLVRLGDIAAGLSIPLNDLVWLYGTTMTQGRLFTQDLRQFQGRGIPLADELAKQFGVAKDKVGELVTAGKVGFPEVQKAIEAMTNDGGKFGGLMEAQSKTITGQISNIEDAIDTMYNNIGKSSEGFINEALSDVSYLIENYEELGKIILELVATYGAYKAVLIAITALQKVNSSVVTQAAIEQHFAAIAGHKLSDAQAITAAKTKLLTIAQQGLIKSLKSASTALVASPYVFAAAAIAGVSLAIYKVITAESELDKAAIRLKEANSEVGKSLASEVSKLTSLERKLAETKKGTKEYNDIKKTIVDNYSQYYKGLDGEIDRVGNLSTVYGELVEKMRLSIGQRKFESFFKAEQDNLDNTIGSKLDKAYDALIEKYGKDKGAKLYQQVFDYVIRGTSMSVDTWKQLGEATFNEWGFDNSPVGFAARSVSSLIGDINQVTQASAKALDDFKVKYQMTEKDIENILSGNPLIEESTGLSSISKEIADTTTKIAKLKQELADLRSGKTTVEAGKTVQSVIESKVKDLKTAEDTLATLTGVDKKGADKQLSARQELSRAILENELKLQASRTSALEDGKEKRLALINQEYDETIAAINKERAEYDKKVKEAGGLGSEAVYANFDNRKLAAGDKKNTDISQLDKEYIKDFAEHQKQLSDVFLSEEAKRLSAIKDRYDKEREWADTQLRTGGMTTDQHNAYTHDIDQAEAQENLKSLLDKYQDYDAKRREIDDKYNQEVATLSYQRTEQNKAEVNAAIIEARKRQKEEIAALYFSEFQDTDLWNKMFGDLDKMAISTLESILNKAKEVNTSAWSPEQVKEYQDAIDRLEDAVRSRNPFKSIKKDWDNLLAAMKKGSKDDVAKALDGIDRAVQKINQDLGTIAGGIEDIFGDEAGYAAKQVTELTSALGGFVTGASKFASGDILGGVASVVSSIGSIFSIGKKVKEMNAAARAEQQKFYDEARAGELEYHALLRERLRITQQIGESSLQYFDRLQKELHSQSGSIGKEYDEVWSKLMGEQYIEKVNYRHGTWFRKAKTWNDYGDLSGKTYEEIESLYTQNKLTDSAKVLFEQLRKLKEEGANVVDMMDDLNQSMSEAWTGTTEDAISRSILDGIAKGKNGVDDLTTYFRDMMKNAMLQGVNMKYLQEPIKKFYKEFADMSESDGMLTESEIKQLKDMYTTMVENAQAQFDNLQKISGLDFSTDKTSDNSLKGAYAKANQESIGLLAGQTGAVRVLLEDINNNIQPIREQMQFIRDLQVQGWKDVEAIKVLVGKLKDVSDKIYDAVDEIKGHTGELSEYSERTVNAVEGRINVNIKGM